MTVFEAIQRIPEGYIEGMYEKRKYGITKQSFNKGKSCKVFGKALGSSDFISLNYYHTRSGGLLKPCEMEESKVVAFLKNVMIT
ncbi:peptide methionine sulfoxide reductase [Maribacter sp. 2-571]|uniref:peptide methionine sulfoxide reductase n=1 Tax=Maribacter sp. 2-571 TaxID=3417569 RepID=UPI003D345B1B